ncbi:MAG TPA: hypothetical protein VM070_07400 [Candidatus Saccharimonadales bacterium]|nr:hypothetical protein [Candidatus Saccharimonadales bacterium]
MAVAVLSAACGAGAAGRDAAGAPEPVVRSDVPAELIALTTDSGTLRIDARTGQTLVTLPPGAATPDWRRYWTVGTAASGAAATTLRELDPATGAELRRLEIEGRWAMPSSYGAAPSGFSTDGSWLVLAAPQTKIGGATTSAFAVIDTVRASVARTVVAPGDHTFDAISADGRSLYVVEHLGAPAQYRVRVAGGGGVALSTAPIVDIKVAAPQMNGIYHSSIMRGGTWNYGLYFSPTKGAFIHALNTTQLYAQCILDVPDGGPGVRAAWSMISSPVGSHLYLVNGPAGMIADIGPESLRLERSALQLAGAVKTTERRPDHGAAISPDGSRIYAIGDDGLVVITTSDLAVRARYLRGTPVRSLALSPDGQRLYVLAEDGSLTRLDAATGKPAGTVPTAARATALLAVAAP